MNNVNMCIYFYIFSNCETFCVCVWGGGGLLRLTDVRENETV